MKLPNYVKGQWSEGTSPGELSLIQSPDRNWRGYLRRALILQRLSHLHALTADLLFAGSATPSELKYWARWLMPW